MQRDRVKAPPVKIPPGHESVRHHHVVGWSNGEDYHARKVGHSHIAGDTPHMHSLHPAAAYEGDERVPYSGSNPVRETLLSVRKGSKNGPNPNPGPAKQ